MKKLALTVVTTAALAICQVHAVPVLWKLDVTISHGGTATGSFVYDADTNLYSAVAITTTGPLANLYTTAGVFAWDAFGFDAFTAIPAASGGGFFTFVTSLAMTNAGGMIPVSAGGEATCITPQTHNSCSLGAPSGSITSGYVKSSVPEPTTLGLLAASLAALVFRRRRTA